MSRVCRLFVILSAFLALPGMGYAQEAVLTGTVTDATGGVLPGVTVTALNDATGNTFIGVTDGTGSWRIPARVGAYQITAELQGFTTVQRTGVQLLVGQTIAVNMQMNPSTIQETVTGMKVVQLFTREARNQRHAVDQLHRAPVNREVQQVAG